MPEAEHPAFDAFVSTVAQLRSPQGGCPWNRAQTHESIGDYLIEEAYEALDAVQSGSVAHLREELGDVLLQVVLQSQIAADAGEFTIDDVCADIDQKMIRRHPHVFAGVAAENANEVADLWEQVKLAEKQHAAEQAASAECEDRPHLLDDVPTHFPALLQAQKISRRAVAAGFEWDTIDDVWQKVAEERAELQAAYDKAPKTDDGKVLETEGRERDALVAAAEMEFGDMLFALVNVARKMGIDAEAALRASNAKFRRRFAKVEEGAWSEGRAVEDLTLDEMEAYWQSAKEGE
ncbi:MAG: nucleoside triphosphate pyrophosphohydrolase [Eggerthellaceae bacterium]|nr:nucleoside triphosphate pyrophosphohydrolase [Eggerthellaceae bacterium]